MAMRCRNLNARLQVGTLQVCSISNSTNVGPEQACATLQRGSCSVSDHAIQHEIVSAC